MMAPEVDVLIPILAAVLLTVLTVVRGAWLLAVAGPLHSEQKVDKK